jgi:hypothetical protein
MAAENHKPLSRNLFEAEPATSGTLVRQVLPFEESLAKMHFKYKLLEDRLLMKFALPPLASQQIAHFTGNDAQEILRTKYCHGISSGVAKRRKRRAGGNAPSVPDRYTPNGTVALGPARSKHETFNISFAPS